MANAGAVVQVGQSQHRAGAQCHGFLQQVFQLAHIAGQGVAQQPVHGVDRQGGGAFSGAAQPQQQGPDQPWHVATALAQRRQADLDHIEAVKQVLPEHTFVDPL